MSERGAKSRPLGKDGLPLTTMNQPGYYPGYSTLAEQGFWDVKTREVVLQRVTQVPEIRFFTPGQAQLLKAISDHIIPQDDRTAARRIPIVPKIDERLYMGRHDGYRYEDMPSDCEAYRLGLDAIEECARYSHNKTFLDLSFRQQEEILRSLHDHKPAAGHATWQRMSLHHFWLMLVGDCAEAYYSHPWAWDEIGYGGPAYPRGYMRLVDGQPEPWEKNEQRYEWQAPPDALSDIYEPMPSAIEIHPHDRASNKR
jgi:Gluconate 2-dehydrogenase subunit 3